MRRLLALLVAAGATTAGLAACGGGTSGTTATALPQVHLRVSSPADSFTTRGTTITVKGTVQPAGASVQVLGQAAEVVGSSFTAQVDLQPGANVIDLAATAPRRDPALTAIRVIREMPVAVPDLSGKSADDAKAALATLGLTIDVRDGDGLLDSLLPGTPGVCDQDPSAGSEVTRGTKVRVLVAKHC